MPTVPGLISYLVGAALLFVSIEAACGRRRRGVEGKSSLSVSGLDMPKEQWFTQQLDHFNMRDNRTWSQRYWVRDDFYKEGGPVFLVVDGEWEANPDEMYGVPWEWYAKQSHAKLLLVEHRFYGQSRPTSDMSTANLEYLTSRQALADLAKFINATNIQLPPDTRWVAFGCSYGGNLAAWLRKMYSHLVHAAVASSAPLLAKLDYSEYLDNVKESLSFQGDDCVQTVQEAQKELEQLLQISEGRKEIFEKFGLCEPLNITDEMEVYNLYGELVDKVTETVQYNSYDSERKQSQLSILCGILTNSSIGGALDRYAKMDKEMTDNDKECRHHSYNYTIKKLRNITMWTAEPDDENFIGRQWTYQMCNEFGYFQTSQGKRSLLGDRGKGIPLRYFVRYCSDTFGDEYTQEFMQKAVDNTNLFYGALDIQDSRVLYTHGSYDPWNKLGLTKKRKMESSPVILINGASHCSDTNHPEPSDSKDLVNARNLVGEIITSWLQEPPPLVNSTFLCKNIGCIESTHTNVSDLKTTHTNITQTKITYMNNTYNKTIQTNTTYVNTTHTIVSYPNLIHTNTTYMNTSYTNATYTDNLLTNTTYVRSSHTNTTYTIITNTTHPHIIHTDTKLKVTENTNIIHMNITHTNDKSSTVPVPNNANAYAKRTKTIHVICCIFCLLHAVHYIM